jgi:hypothetical protein
MKKLIAGLIIIGILVIGGNSLINELKDAMETRNAITSEMFELINSINNIETAFESRTNALNAVFDHLEK